MTEASRQGFHGRPPVGPPGHPRLFVAVPIPADVATQVGQLVDEVRGALGPDGDRVRWVQMEGLHVTLRFIGPTPPGQVEAVGDAVERAAAVMPAPFELRFGGAGAFPDAQRPRALWVGIRTGAEELGRLSASLTAELLAAGWAIEDRPFRPHLTIARTDGVHAGAAAGQLLVAAAAGLDAAFEPDRVVLFRSHLGRGPARYEALRSAVFG